VVAYGVSGGFVGFGVNLTFNLIWQRETATSSTKVSIKDIDLKMVLKCYPTNKPLKGMFMSQNCVFCRIVHKQASASVSMKTTKLSRF
jgi:hypothetical protein